MTRHNENRFTPSFSTSITRFFFPNRKLEEENKFLGINIDRREDNGNNNLELSMYVCMYVCMNEWCDQVGCEYEDLSTHAADAKNGTTTYSMLYLLSCKSLETFFLLLTPMTWTLIEHCRHRSIPIPTPTWAMASPSIVYLDYLIHLPTTRRDMGYRLIWYVLHIFGNHLYIQSCNV